MDLRRALDGESDTSKVKISFGEDCLSGTDGEAAVKLDNNELEQKVLDGAKGAAAVDVLTLARVVRPMV